MRGYLRGALRVLYRSLLGWPIEGGGDKGVMEGHSEPSQVYSIQYIHTRTYNGGVNKSRININDLSSALIPPPNVTTSNNEQRHKLAPPPMLTAPYFAMKLPCSCA